MMKLLTQQRNEKRLQIKRVNIIQRRRNKHRSPPTNFSLTLIILLFVALLSSTSHFHDTYCVGGFLIRVNTYPATTIVNTSRPSSNADHGNHIITNRGIMRRITSSTIHNNIIHPELYHQQQHPPYQNIILAATRKGKETTTSNNEKTKSDDTENNSDFHHQDNHEITLSLSPTSTSVKPVSSSSNIKNDDILSSAAGIIPEIKLYKKRKQKRRKLKHPRRPSSFWADINNIESELRKFWNNINVPIPANEPPPLPNEALLNHFERNDLRYAIANMGGRESVSFKLNGAKLIPGKWKTAVTTCKEVQYLLHPSNPAGKGLSEDVPPIAPYIKRTLEKQRLAMKITNKKRKQQEKHFQSSQEHEQKEGKKVKIGEEDGDGNVYKNIDVNKYFVFQSKNNETVDSNDIMLDEDYDDVYSDIDSPIETLRFRGQRWAHSSDRNPRGHWSMDVIIQELYQYLSRIKEEKGRPSVWMPRPSELATEGRNDLKQAMLRFGGSTKTCELAKLVPYRDWRYFESTLELYVELLKYLMKYHDGSEKVFPKLADIQANGHERLYDLIMEYGGRKLIAAKLDMEFQAQTKLDLYKDMSFGPFSLDFAVRLMSFVRNDMMEKDPPLDKAYIQMPTRQYLLEKGETKLLSEISKYGGHENIARRLNLVFDEDEATREATMMLLKEE